MVRREIIIPVSGASSSPLPRLWPGGPAANDTTITNAEDGTTTTTTTTPSWAAVGPLDAETASQDGLTQPQKYKQQFFKTKMCPWEVQGRCHRQAQCNFAHSAEELRVAPNLTRTSLCPNLLKKGECRRADCQFAHAIRELRATGSFYKTKLCTFWGKGVCKAGVTCRYAHGQEELELFLQLRPDPLEAKANNTNSGSGSGSQEQADDKSLIDDLKHILYKNKATTVLQAINESTPPPPHKTQTTSTADSHPDGANRSGGSTVDERTGTSGPPLSHPPAPSLSFPTILTVPTKAVRPGQQGSHLMSLIRPIHTASDPIPAPPAYAPLWGADHHSQQQHQQQQQQQDGSGGLLALLTGGDGVSGVGVGAGAGVPSASSEQQHLQQQQQHQQYPLHPHMNNPHMNKRFSPFQEVTRKGEGGFMTTDTTGGSNRQPPHTTQDIRPTTRLSAGRLGGGIEIDTEGDMVARDHHVWTATTTSSGGSKVDATPMPFYQDQPGAAAVGHIPMAATAFTVTPTAAAGTGTAGSTPTANPPWHLPSLTNSPETPFLPDTPADAVCSPIQLMQVCQPAGTHGHVPPACIGVGSGVGAVSGGGSGSSPVMGVHRSGSGVSTTASTPSHASANNPAVAVSPVLPAHLLRMSSGTINEHELKAAAPTYYEE